MSLRSPAQSFLPLLMNEDSEDVLHSLCKEYIQPTLLSNIILFINYAGLKYFISQMRPQARLPGTSLFYYIAKHRVLVSRALNANELLKHRSTYTGNPGKFREITKH